MSSTPSRLDDDVDFVAAALGAQVVGAGVERLGEGSNREDDERFEEPTEECPITGYRDAGLVQVRGGHPRLVGKRVSAASSFAVP
jgi:hypothetical protein